MALLALPPADHLLIERERGIGPSDLAELHADVALARIR
jgi:hypothetical protein